MPSCTSVRATRLAMTCAARWTRCATTRTRRAHTFSPRTLCSPSLQTFHAHLLFHQAFDLLEKLTEVARKVEDVYKRRGLGPQSVGFPTRIEIKQLLAERNNEEGFLT